MNKEKLIFLVADTKENMEKYFSRLRTSFFFLSSYTFLFKRKIIQRIKTTKFNSTEVLSKLKHLNQFNHPNLIKYYESFFDENYFYIVTEYCPVNFNSLSN